MSEPLHDPAQRRFTLQPEEDLPPTVIRNAAAGWTLSADHSGTEAAKRDTPREEMLRHAEWLAERIRVAYVAGYDRERAKRAAASPAAEAP